MSRPSRRANRGLRSRASVVAVVLVGLASIACYAAVSVTVNGEPSTTPFRGFVTILQPAPVFPQDQVKLIASPLIPGGSGPHPGLSYSVAVCGSQPFQGVLLIGGDARLSHLKGTPALGVSNAVGQSSAENLPDLTILDEGTGTLLDLGPVQAIHLTMSHPPKCASPYSAQQAPPPLFLGQGQTITGQAAAPVQRQWRLGWWSGPRTSQSWPLIGDLPGISFNDLGEFRALKGLSGAWFRPGRQYVAVSVGALLSRVIVDQARPQPTSATGLDWDGAQPIQPIAVVTDATSMNTWQNWLVAAGIFLGIGGSLLASLLYEWARPSRAGGPVEEPTPQPPLQQPPRAHPQATESPAQPASSSPPGSSRPEDAGREVGHTESDHD
jgi:hypothetical protein